MKIAPVKGSNLTPQGTGWKMTMQRLYLQKYLLNIIFSPLSSRISLKRLIRLRSKEILNNVQFILYKDW